MSEPPPESWLERPVLKGVGLNWEQGLYLLIILLCLVSRLTMLGYRVESHDESLHCKFSWDLYVGNGFQHNPMMHGPLDFHLVALAFFLFGDSDFTARLPIALLGTVLVAFPYLLRRYLGRAGALAAAVLLLISPSISYYSRYIRHDIPAALWAMVVLWAIFRYLEEGRERHLYLLAAGLSLMFATKEVAFIYTAIFGLFLLGLFVVQALMRPWERPLAETVFTAALVGAVAGLLLLAGGWLLARPPESSPPLRWAVAGGILALAALLTAGAAVLLGLGTQLRSLRSFDLIVLIGTLILPFLSPIGILLAARLGSLAVARYPSAELAPPFWSNLANVRPLDYTAPAIYYSAAVLALMLVVSVMVGLAWNRRRWPVAAAIHIAIFLVFFTTVFSNGAGIASGWVGSLGYWLEQQEVERGTQPWFYYLVILPLYDFLPLLGALAAAILLAVRSALRLATRQRPSLRPDPSPLPFILIWALLSWVGYSYAGEKMPWLTVHIALPMILSAGWLVGWLLERVDWHRVAQRQGWLMPLLVPALGAALSALLQAGGQRPFSGLQLDQLLTTGTFLGGLAGLALMGTLVGVVGARLGWRNTLLTSALAGLAALGMLTIHVAYRLNFVNFDRPAEFLVYAHEGPDVRTTMEQLEELSLRLGRGPRMIDVAYGPDGSWPFIWYLRDYPNARYYPAQPSREQVLATAVIAGREQWAVVEPYVGEDYYSFDYFFLWWPMEDYRQLTWHRLWDWLSDGNRRAALWDIFYRMDYRRYDEITGGHHTPDQWPLRGEFRLYLRKDVVDRMWSLGVAAPAEEQVEVTDPYAAGWQPLVAQRVWGTQGSSPGQFSWPRGIAVSSDGFVYVADSQNHRVQKFTTDGQFVTAWGTFGGCPEMTPPPATFCEPWGVAVGPDGTVYVADTWAHRVQHFTSDGHFLSQWGFFSQYSADRRPGAFYGPRALTVGPDGTVYVADTGDKRVQVFGPQGQFLREWGGGGSAPGQLDEPVGLALDPDGRVLVADTWNHRVQVLEPDGWPVLQWPIAGWNNPAAEEKPYLAVDAEGRVYVTDPGHYRVLVFDRQGNYLYGFGQFGFDWASFGLPTGIALGPDGALYVTDAVNHRVMVFALAPDLRVTSLTVEPSEPAAGEPVAVSVVVQNVGETAAGPFWVDLYDSPVPPPAESNQPWSELCSGAIESCYGMAWYVDDGLAPGRSVLLSSLSGYAPEQTHWPGSFGQSGAHVLWAFVDSWNWSVRHGAVLERNERLDNRYGPVLVNVR